jgi:hypothetical protein
MRASPNVAPIAKGRTLGSSAEPRLKIKRMPKPT